MNIYSNKRRSVKAGATLERENDMEIVLRDDDGAQLRVVYRPNVKGYVIRRTLNDGGNGRFEWDQSKEIYDTAEEAKQAALDGRVTFNFKGRKTPPLPVKSSTRRRSVKCNYDKTYDISYVMHNHMNSSGFALEQDLGNGKYVVSYQGTPVTIEFDPSFYVYVYNINGEGPYAHNSYEYIYDDIREYVDSITDEWGNVIASANKAVYAAEVNSDAYRKDMEQIQYYAQKVWQDIQGAAKVFLDSREQFVPIDVPEVYGDEYFYEWYYQDYIDNFAEVHSKDADIDVSYSRNVPAINVSYGYFDSKELYNYGDDEESLCEFVQSFNSMEDLYFVTSEYGYTIADLANDPYAVFDAVYGDDEYEKANAAYEVRIEFDLWTQSDQVYDMTSDAQKFVDLYNEVADYFSYDNAERLLEEYNATAEEY